ncbi:hypothetical protein WJX73_010728 [Symbiochloris irregularis]|uniref:Rieske domain-containing protein n=1 Tax=Symbiochloris irregularis TaxID=706552 RepID=A0AAW1NN29_9CHLO
MVVAAVLRSHELPEGGKVYKELGNRSVLLLRRHGVTYCLDAHCHHMGLSLANGEVTDVEDTPVITCPWHHRKIGLATGCLVGSTGCTQQRQRTHEVREVGGTIWVNIQSEPEQQLESDQNKSSFPSGVLG